MKTLKHYIKEAIRKQLKETWIGPAQVKLPLQSTFPDAYDLADNILTTVDRAVNIAYGETMISSSEVDDKKKIVAVDVPNNSEGKIIVKGIAKALASYKILKGWKVVAKYLNEATQHHVGLKLERVVIEGPEVKKYKDAIIATAKKHDPDSELKFYPATGKIVGLIAKVKIEFLVRDLRSLGKDTKLKIKPQSKG